MNDQDPFDQHEPTKTPERKGHDNPRLAMASARVHNGSAGTTGGQASGSRLDPMYPLRVIYKRRWLAATTCLVVVLGSILQGLSVVPVYEGRVRLLIENERLNLVKFQDVRDYDRTSMAYYQTQYMILQSRSLARRTLAKLKAAGLTQPSRPVPQRLTFKNAIPKAWSGVKSVFTGSSQPAGTAATAPDRGAAVTFPAPSAAAPATQPPTVALDASEVDGFLSGLVVSPVPTSRLVDIRYRSTDPVLAARYANAVVQEYIEQNLEFKFLATKEAAEWLAGRLSEQRQKVQAAEEALQRYREQTGVLSADVANDGAIQKLDTLANAVTNARATRIEKEALHNQAQAVLRNSASVEALPAVLSNAYVQQLKTQLTTLNERLTRLLQEFGEKHPEVVAAREQIKTTETKLQSEIGKVVESVRAEYVAAQAAERSMEQAFDEQKRAALALNKSGLGLAILQREAEGHRQIYEMLTQRSKETDLTSDIKSNDVRIIDAAEVPRSARGPAPLDGVKYGFLWGLVAAIGLTFLIEHLDSRIKTAEELTSLLELPFLGMLPEIKPGDAKNMLLTKDPSGHYAESFRTVRTNLLFSVFEPGNRTVVVTSAGVGEGKTMVASNLGVAIAQIGQRVLLIDGDLRRPRLNQMFDCSVGPGLSELLVGAAKGSDVVRQSGIPGLWVLPAGSTPPNPAELLGSERFNQLLRHVEQRFDWVIVDSPPVIPVTDAALIAHEVAGVVFVGAADRTTRYSAKAAVSALLRNGAHVVGTVLNRVDIVRNRYYYPSAYRKDYGKYYAKASNG